MSDISPVVKVRRDFPENDPHLGGHGFKNHLDEGVLIFFQKQLNCKSVLDVGCGLGKMVSLARSLGYDADGIDGDYSVNRDVDVIIHDYVKGPYDHKKRYDLAYSCEFVEHVEQKYIPNFMVSFQVCSHVIMTFAPLKSKKGHHHVNCNTSKYWIKMFNRFGFVYDDSITRLVRKHSSMGRDFVRKNGLYFKNEN
jgi:hypothetical protein